ncbi:hypothetical protein [Citreimonas salinaria]|uniref:hypothetical protein n=1 Tax=Citreimonas salinaria TaxID=321339 RepID=UPI0015A5B37F|nr:hypothetical protein [Citreimonas salinaria]
MKTGDDALRTGTIMATSLGLAALGVAALGSVADQGGAYATAAGPALSAPALAEDAARVAPDYLAVIYDAFGRTDEGEIYDTLAMVAGGEALVTLYLERMGAMAGVDYEPDQTVFEMDMLDLDARQFEGGVWMDATWHVMGLVGHEGHRHVRDNTYSARFEMTPESGAWRITRFTLTDAERITADAGGAAGQ